MSIYSTCPDCGYTWSDARFSIHRCDILKAEELLTTTWSPVSIDTPTSDAILMRPIDFPDQLHIAIWDDGQLDYGSTSGVYPGWVDESGWSICDPDGFNGNHRFEYMKIQK